MFYSDWFIFYVLPTLLHLAFTWYTYSVHTSTEFMEMLKNHRKDFEEDYYPVDDIPLMMKILFVISFIPLINIVSDCAFIFYFCRDVFNSFVSYFKE